MTTEEITKISEWFAGTDIATEFTVEDQLQVSSIYIEFLNKIKPFYEKYTMHDGKPVQYLFKM